MPRPSDRQPTSPAAPDRHLARIPGSPRTAGRIVWSEAWKRERRQQEWLCRPLIPGGGRSTVVYAAKGAGKSDLLLYVGAHLALGRPVLEASPAEPLRVLYIDNEMVVDDVLDRAESFGLGPDDDLDAAFDYYSLPDLPPLDTAEGARDLLALVDHHRSQLVIVDTVTRAVAGEENSSNTILAVGSSITTPLKRAGVSVVWAGHEGKNRSKGQRGTSEHGGIDELVWHLTRRRDGVTVLQSDKRRAESWMPAHVELRRRDRGGKVEWGLAGGGAEVSGAAKELALVLDELGVPPMASVRAASDALKEADQGVRTALVAEAVRWRRGRETPWETPSA